MLLAPLAGRLNTRARTSDPLLAFLCFLSEPSPRNIFIANSNMFPLSLSDPLNLIQAVACLSFLLTNRPLQPPARPHR